MYIVLKCHNIKSYQGLSNLNVFMLLYNKHLAYTYGLHSPVYGILYCMCIHKDREDTKLVYGMHSVDSENAVCIYFHRLTQICCHHNLKQNIEVIHLVLSSALIHEDQRHSIENCYKTI